MIAVCPSAHSSGMRHGYVFTVTFRPLSRIRRHLPCAIIAALWAATTVAEPAVQSTKPADQTPKPVAQPAAPTAPSPPKVKLADHVPDSTSFFVHVTRLDEMDKAMRRAHAYRLLPLLAGATQGRAPNVDLKRILGGFLGDGGHIPVDELMTMELGVVAPSWRDLGAAVWLVRLDDKATFRRWFPKSPPRRSKLSTKPFSTPSGLIVGATGDLVGMARRPGAGLLLSMMTGQNRRSLAREGVYEELVSYLPGNPLAIAYVRDKDNADGGDAPKQWSTPRFDRAVVGLYEGAGRIDFAVRAVVSEPTRAATLSDDALARFARLPQSTLFAWALSVDMGAGSADFDMRSGGLIARLSMLLTMLRGRADAGADATASLGPHVIVAWDQDLRPGSASPQIALMVQSADSAALVREVSSLAEGLWPSLVGAKSADGNAPPCVKRAAYLGRGIHYIPLDDHARASAGPRSELLAGLEPAWASLDGWFVLALSRDHIERLLEAWHGLAPRLNGVPDVRDLLARRAKRREIAIVQADLAAEVLWQWLSDLDGGKPSLLDPTWWSGGSKDDAASKRRLGVAMRTHQIPGKVVVARVYADTAADGVLQPGDRILGINDRLLDVESPNASLREQWELAHDATSAVFRIERGGVLMEVVLAHSPSQPSPLPIEPAQAVRELASLAQGLEFASFSSFVSQPERYSARLSLRLPEESR